MDHSTPAERPVKGRKKQGSRAAKKLPFFQHQTGRWCKKINGRHRYFGYIKDDPDGQLALAFWIENKDALLNGAPLRVGPAAGPTIADTCNEFLTEFEKMVESGERSKRSLADYVTVAKRLANVFGRHAPVSQLTPDDFGRLRANFGRTHGPVALTADIARTKAIFNWAVESEKLPSPPRYGNRFSKPEDRILLLNRENAGERIFDAQQLRGILDGATVDGKRVAGASQPLRSMIFLAINAAVGNSDLGRMPMTAVNLKTGWLDFPRQKTGVRRKVPLWSETTDSIRQWLAVRPTAKDPATEALLFVTSRGGSWYKEVDDNPIAKEFAKLLKRHGLNKLGLSFYRLRHTFRTVASKAKDRDATEAIMAHKPPKGDMSAAYLSRVDDVQLRAVVDVVHDWLFKKSKSE